MASLPRRKRLKILAAVPMLFVGFLGPRLPITSQTAHLGRSMQMVRVPDRILVVDHDQAARQDIETHLSHPGYEVLTASNGEEALGILARQKVSCMIMDGRSS